MYQIIQYSTNTKFNRALKKTVIIFIFISNQCTAAVYCPLGPQRGEMGSGFASVSNILIQIYQIVLVWSFSSSFKSKRWTAGMKYLASLFLLFLCLPSFIHSDPKWFYDLQPAENRAASQRVKTYCGPRSVLFHSHSSKLHSCIINAEHLCGEFKFIKPVSCSAT